MFAGFDMTADGLRLSLDGLGRHLKTSQQLQLFATAVEAGFASHHSHHASHGGRHLGSFDAEFAVTRTVTLMAVRTDIPAALHIYLADRSEQMTAAGIVIAGLMAARAGVFAGMAGRIQQLAQNRGSRAVHAVTGRHFHGFQIEWPVASRRENHAQERLGFPCDFVMNSSSRFFSASVQPD